jgi:hypothetical protein
MKQFSRQPSETVSLDGTGRRNETVFFVISSIGTDSPNAWTLPNLIGQKRNRALGATHWILRHQTQVT